MSIPSPTPEAPVKIRLPRPCLMLVTEPGEDLFSIVSRALDGGVDVVQWRDKRKSIGKRSRFLSGLGDMTKDKALLIANGDWELNVAAGARKVHLPERSIPVGVVKFKIGNGALVGKSVHTAAAAVSAQHAGADYVIAGTIYASPSHPGITPPGLVFLQDVCAAVKIPVIAIGGITPERVGVCIAAGASGVAVLSSIMQAPDPCAAAAAYRVALDRAWAERPSHAP